MVSVSFMTSGQIEVGGSLELNMPDLEISRIHTEVGDSRRILRVKIAESAAMNVSYNSASALSFAVVQAKLAQQTKYTFTMRPHASSRIPPTTMTMKSYDSREGNIDVTASMVIDAIVAGTLESASFAMATDTPGFESMATVTFRTAGRVEVGGKVKLVMPPQDLDTQYGWRFTNGAPTSRETIGTKNAPSVVFIEPSSNTPMANAVNTRLQRGHCCLRSRLTNWSRTLSMFYDYQCADSFFSGKCRERWLRRRLTQRIRAWTLHHRCRWTELWRALWSRLLCYGNGYAWL